MASSLSVPRVIGLTGGIASGKSTVGRQLRQLGAVVVDADEVARAVVEEAPGIADEPAIREVRGDVVRALAAELQVVLRVAARVRSYNKRDRSPRRISTSPDIRISGSVATVRPAVSSRAIALGRVRAAQIGSHRPRRSSTARWTGPRKSTAWPPSRSAGARSTRVVAKPPRCRHSARAGPAMPAPEMRTCCFFIRASVLRTLYLKLRTVYMIEHRARQSHGGSYERASLCIRSI